MYIYIFTQNMDQPQTITVSLKLQTNKRTRLSSLGAKVVEGSRETTQPRPNYKLAYAEQIRSLIGSSTITLPTLARQRNKVRSISI